MNKNAGIQRLTAGYEQNNVIRDSILELLVFVLGFVASFLFLADNGVLRISSLIIFGVGMVVCVLALASPLRRFPRIRELLLGALLIVGAIVQIPSNPASVVFGAVGLVTIIWAFTKR